MIGNSRSVARIPRLPCEQPPVSDRAPPPLLGLGELVYLEMRTEVNKTLPPVPVLYLDLDGTVRARLAGVDFLWAADWRAQAGVQHDLVAPTTGPASPQSQDPSSGDHLITPRPATSVSDGTGGVHVVTALTLGREDAFRRASELAVWAVDGQGVGNHDTRSPADRS